MVGRGMGMAYETVHELNRITRDPDIASGKAVVKGTHVAVEQVLTQLAANLDVDALLRDYPDLTRDDVRAVLAYARDRIRHDDEPAHAARAVSPQAFYAEITKRPDVSELMRRLAR